ncbi:cytochrome P450 [Nocardia sp. NBC_01009]|uniref:cytochrome P450 n=1 Tax=Nocardia sp. NBC_01009 TaxID=2975996 RepID=UPI00386489A4|nr:cytochrome P450 [Nocardia sp. NBC_01009]
MTTAHPTQPLPPLVSGAAPVIGHLLEFKRDHNRLIQRGYDECGEIFRFKMPATPTTVVLLGEHTKQFFKASELSIRGGYTFLPRILGDRVYFLAPHEDYLRQKGFVHPRFAGRQLATYVSVINDEAQQLVQQLGASGDFELMAPLGPMIRRISARCFVGDAFTRSLPAELLADLDILSGGVGFSLPAWLPLPVVIRSRRARERLRNALMTLIRKRRAEERAEDSDFLQSLVDHRDLNGDPVPDHELVGLILLLIWSGQDTTTAHLAWLLVDLLGHPDEMALVREESERVISEGVSLGGLQRMSRTTACIQETGRLRAPAHMLSRSVTTDFKVGEYTIPQGAQVLASPAISQRDPNIFVRPDTYQPTRFLGPAAKPLYQALIGFGSGTHRCLGQNFATIVMQIVVAHLATTYDMQLIGTPRPSDGFAAKYPAGQCIVRYRRRV